MKNAFFLIAFFLIALATPGLWAKAQTEEGEDKGKKKEMPPVPVFLGNSEYQGGEIPQAKFDSLMAQGLRARDTAGLEYGVEGFLLSFAERNLYEDSIGNLIVLTDLHSHYCFGDSLDIFLQNNLPQRTKAGDTIYFDQIKLQHPNGFALYGQSMKFTLTR